MIRIAVSDDNIDDLNISEKLPREYSSGKMPGDLYFFDIIMPDMTGIEFAEVIKTYDPEAGIIITSTSKEYALDVFGLHAAAYLLKPFNKKRLYETLDMVLPENKEALFLRL